MVDFLASNGWLVQYFFKTCRSQLSVTSVIFLFVLGLLHSYHTDRSTCGLFGAFLHVRVALEGAGSA